MDILTAKSQADFKHRGEGQEGICGRYIGHNLHLVLREENKDKPYDAVMALSGGLDSTCLLAKVIRHTPDGRNRSTGTFNVLGVNFQYGSKHNEKEADAFNRIADHYKIDTLSVDFGDLFAPMSTSSLMKDGGIVPQGHYEEESMRSTVVHGRNTIFASYLIGLAQSVNAASVFLGIHAGDHHIYPDCRPMWWSMMNIVAMEVSERKLKVLAPFINHTKDMIVADGISLKVPFADTHTCYSPTVSGAACGRCGSCQERLTAFAMNGVVDPLPYETRELLPKKGS